MSTADLLAPGERCLATGKGLHAKPKPGTVEAVLGKRYMVLLDGETEAQPFGLKKVKRVGKPAKKVAPVTGETEGWIATIRDQRPPTRLTIPDANVPTIQLLITDDILPFEEPNPAARAAAYAEFLKLGLTPKDAQGCGFQRRDILASLTPQPKPRKPSRSAAYLQHVRQHDCCNCGVFGPSDPDHVGSRGVGQKCSDYETAPLCRDCHRTRTDKNSLPRPQASKQSGRLMLRERVETELILLRAQVQCLREWAEKIEKETP